MNDEFAKTVVLGEEVNHTDAQRGDAVNNEQKPTTSDETSPAADEQFTRTYSYLT